MELVMINDLEKPNDEIVKKEIRHYNGESYKPNWIRYNGKLYYFKGHERIEFTINELLGSMVSNYLGLPTVNYTIAKEDHKFMPIYGVMSPCFKEPDKEYFDGFELSNHKIINKPSNIRIFKKVCKDNNNYEELIKQFLDKCAVDIYISQIDSVPGNTYFEKKDGKVLLAPLFDFSASFNTTLKNQYYDFCHAFPSYTYAIMDNLEYKAIRYTYGNFIFYVTMPSKEFKTLLKNYPSFGDSLDKVSNFNVNDALDEISDSLDINIPKELKKHYINECRIKSDLLKSVI